MPFSVEAKTARRKEGFEYIHVVSLCWVILLWNESPLIIATLLIYEKFRFHSHQKMGLKAALTPQNVLYSSTDLYKDLSVLALVYQ